MRVFKVAALAACVGLTACATMVNPGKARTAPDAGSGGATVARVNLNNIQGGVSGPLSAMQPNFIAIYRGNERIEIREGVTGFERQRWVLHCNEILLYSGRVGPCSDLIYFPYIELERSGSHQLRLVRGQEQTTVTLRASLKLQWIWLNGIWGPAAPVGWLADAVSGRWKYFGRLDVDRAFRNGQSSAGSN